MADKPAEPSSFSFTTSGSSGGGLFGSAGNTGGSGLFGSTTSQAPASGGLFGSTSSSAQKPNPFGTNPASSAPSQPTLFGAASTGGAPSSGLFGTGNNLSGGGASSGLFSTPNKTTEGQDPKPSGIFGGVGSNSSNVFGQTSNSAQAGSSTPAEPRKFSFPNPSTTPAGPPPSGTGTQSLFGNQPKLQGQSSSVFGAPSSTATSALKANPFASIGSGQSNPPDSGVKAPSSQAGSNIFGAATSKPDGSGGSGAASLFSNLNKPQTASTQDQGESSKPASSGIFGNAAGGMSAKPASSQPAAQSAFANVLNMSASTSSAQSGQPATGSVFGNTSGGPAAPAATKSLFSNLNTSQPTTSESTTTSVAPTQSLFSGLGSNKPATPSSTSGEAPKTTSLFANLGTSKPANQEGGQAATTAASTSASTSASTAMSLFPGTSKAPESTGASQPPSLATATAQSEDASKSSNIASSTSGPRPTPQSRLKNKSMDEIITRWASDLTKYQKEFQGQALKVAEWDKMLVKNSDKIQKLYGSTLEAERATVEVERQLSAVENDQAELEYWLDHYEKQVDEMMTSQVGQGDSLSGPDQERERTYKLAEKLSDRLDELNKDLTSMVEEINDASSHLSKTGKADDPLSQIVRVLNGHLMQLQQIDQGTTALQAKVTAAQNASRSLGLSNGGSGLESDAVDDFYRSYMGRR